MENGQKPSKHSDIFNNYCSSGNNSNVPNVIFSVDVCTISQGLSTAIYPFLKNQLLFINFTTLFFVA